MWPNPQETEDLVTFTEKILNGKLHFLCSATLYKCQLTTSQQPVFHLFSKTCFIVFSHQLEGKNDSINTVLLGHSRDYFNFKYELSKTMSFLVKDYV